MSAWPAGVRREIHAELDSTNAEALRRAASGEGGPAWILARRQTAARGRRSRPWTEPPGHFAATLLMRPDATPAQAALRSFVAALALRDALVAVTGRPELFALKWPNDVLLGGRKLAGILLEASGPPTGPVTLAIGIGVNLGAAPDPKALEPEALTPVGLAETTGLAVAPEDFLDHLAPAFARWEAVLATQGFAPVRTAWLAAAARLGATVTARLPGQSITGRFETIDPTGAIVLVTPKGRMTLPAAELFFDDAPGG